MCVILSTFQDYCRQIDPDSEEEESGFAAEALLTTKEESNGCIVLDSGATEGVGSLEALDALQEERVKSGMVTDMYDRRARQPKSDLAMVAPIMNVGVYNINVVI